MSGKLLKYLLLLLCSVFVFPLVAQNEIAHIYGQLKDQSTKKKLDGCMVQVFKDGASFDSFDAGTTGKYDFKLPLGFTYDIKFSKGDYLSKIIRIDTRNIPEEDRMGGFDMNIDGTLFPYREGFNTDLLKEPLAKASYSPGGDELEFDFPYSEKKAKEIEAEFKRLDDMEKNFEKLKAQFDELVKEGDQKMLEKKYADAVSKYKGALAIFPKDEPVKVKLADAQAKLDAENSNKDLEAKYKKFVDDGDKAFKDKKYDAAKKNFQDANKLKSAEVYPKEMLYQIELAMKDAGRRADYDAIIADADKKFQNNDFAVSIERYKEASTMYPTESYPKDQILKAEAALKDMLAFEAEKLRIQKEYDNKIVLAERSVGEDNLEQAIGHYRAASELKPLEKMPKEKIDELTALIAERKSQKDANDANALANAEKERIEKEYNDLIAAADELFVAEKLSEARSKYEEAIIVKSDALYPKSKIETIDMLIARNAELLVMDAAKALQDSLDAANLAEQLAAEERLKAELEKERLDAERRAQLLEDERLAAEAKLKAKKRNWHSDADREAEDQVESYYREAAEKEYLAKVAKVDQNVKDYASFYAAESERANASIKRNEELITASKENQIELKEIGTSIQNAAIADNERKKKDTTDDRSNAKQLADNRMRENETKIEEKKQLMTSVTENDRNRQSKVVETQDKKERITKNNESYESKGNTLRAENRMKVENAIEGQQQVAYDGEKVRQENEDKVEDRIKDEQTRDKDLRRAADQRVLNSSLEIDKKKSDAESLGDGKEYNTNKKANEIETQKRDIEFAERQRESQSANDRFDARKEAFDKKGGEPKKEEEYLQVPGTEHLKEGVTENSYKLGQKMVTERTVKVGNKVDKYKKVVSKTAIYYFRNGQSITEVTWRQATLSEPE